MHPAWIKRRSSCSSFPTSFLFVVRRARLRCLTALAVAVCWHVPTPSSSFVGARRSRSLVCATPSGSSGELRLHIFDLVVPCFVSRRSSFFLDVSIARRPPFWRFTSSPSLAIRWRCPASLLTVFVSRLLASARAALSGGASRELCLCNLYLFVARSQLLDLRASSFHLSPSLALHGQPSGERGKTFFFALVVHAVTTANDALTFHVLPRAFCTGC